MSIVPKEAILAQSIGINNLFSDAAFALAPDVDHRMREIMQEAIKCMRHSRRIRLTTDDVDTVLSLRNVEHAAGLCNSRRLKMFPTLPSLPAHAVWRKKKRVVTTLVPETIKRSVAITSGENIHASTSSRNENNHHCISGSRDRMEETDCRSWKMSAVLSQVW